VDPLRRAADLLAGTAEDAELSSLLAFLSFERSAALDAPAAKELCVPHCEARVARGKGSLRALIVECSADIATAEVIRHSALLLAAKTPHLLWTIIVRNRPKSEIAIACWRTVARVPRIVAMIADRRRVIESDCETLCALSDTCSDSDLLTHARWTELLGREAITRRFFRALRSVVENLSDSLPQEVSVDDRRELAILYASRLLFLSFIETRGWLNADFDFLANAFAKCMTGGGNYHRRVLLPLFFGTLNTPLGARAPRAKQFGRIPFLNGGLFARSDVERRQKLCFFTDAALGEVFERLLTSYRFTAKEDTRGWSETAVDPEILGKAFEALMAAADRKTSGAFYTPQRLVEHVTESALVGALAGSADKAMLHNLLSCGELPNAETRAELLSGLRELKLLDPACGSGAFLVHALERLAELRLRLGEIGTSASIRRNVLSSSIFGVDINPMAVWLCQLRLWLAIVVESGDADPLAVRPLPNLDRQIRIGDSLAGGSFGRGESAAQGRRLAALRARYMRSVGRRKQMLARQLDREERREALLSLDRLRIRLHGERKELVMSSRSSDLFGARTFPSASTIERIRALRAAERSAAMKYRRLNEGAALPFAFDAHFADVARAGGFHVIVGNPPWVRIHNIARATRQILKRDFATFRNGPWKDGAARAGSGSAFAAQIDLAALFLERSTFLLRENGALALLLPAKLWRSLSGGGTRLLVKNNLEIIALEDMTEAKSGFDAAVYPSLLVARRRKIPSVTGNSPIAAAVYRHGNALQWQQNPEQLPFDRSADSPWLLLPRDVRASFDALTSSGVPLCETQFGRPLLGVKTGCNDAFIIRLDHAIDNEAAHVETGLLRPVVRGETITAWRFTPNGERILWTNTNGEVLKVLPPAAARWLGRWRSTLERRSDARGTARWWSLFRTDGAYCKNARVVWGDFGKVPRALVLAAGEDVVPLNTCYVVFADDYEDALALAALINGPLLAAWLNILAEPARGGYRRYLGWTMSFLPLPRDWRHARENLAGLGAAARSGNLPTQHDLLMASIRAFRVRKSSVEALLSWTHRS